MVYPSTFLYLSPRDLLTSPDPFRFLVLSDSFKKATTLTSNEKYSQVEMVSKEVRDFTIDKHPMFTRLPLHVQHDPIAQFVYEQYPSLSATANATQKTQNIETIFTENWDDVISQNLNEFVKLLSHRRTEKDSTEVNFYGSLQRAKLLLEDKRKILAEKKKLLELI